MTETNRSPHYQLMALLTLHSKAALVNVIALVAFGACHRGIFEGGGQVAVLTSGCGMTTF